MWTDDLCCCYYSYLDLPDHINLSRCSKSLNKISRRPAAMPHNLAISVTTATLKKALSFRPKKLIFHRTTKIDEDIKSVTHADVYIYTPIHRLKDLEELNLYCQWSTGLYTLTKLTSLTYHHTFMLLNKTEIPTSLRKLSLYGSHAYVINQLASHHIETLNLSYGIVPNNLRLTSIHTLKLDHISMCPAIYPPNLTDLTIHPQIIDSKGWIKSIKVDKLHINAIRSAISTDALVQLKSRAKIFTVAMEIRRPLKLLPQLADNIISLVVTHHRFDLKILIPLRNLEHLDMKITHQQMKISRGESQFKYWPKLNEIIFGGNFFIFKQMLNFIHGHGVYRISADEKIAHKTSLYLARVKLHGFIVNQN